MSVLPCVMTSVSYEINTLKSAKLDIALSLFFGVR